MKNTQSGIMLPELIMNWYSQNKRDLPWRKNKEPYRVWLSEIMLQQTRVTAAIPYYERFLAELPGISELAAASEERIYKLWQGLGYYSRARNLRKAADVIMREHDGIFPDKYEQILKLPGIGSYTAGAIASICFDAPIPAVDGNVLRLMARIEEFTGDISLAAVKKEIRETLAQIYPKSNCGDFTQGLIELGATVCIPGSKPKCGECPVKNICKALRSGTVSEIPVKKLAKKRKHEEITVFVFVCSKKFAVRKRENKGLLAGLWEFPNYKGWLTSVQALSLASDWGVKPEGIATAAKKTHIFTHIDWDMQFYLIPCNEQSELSAPFLWVSEEELRNIYAIPAAFQLPDFESD